MSTTRSVVRSRSRWAGALLALILVGCTSASTPAPAATSSPTKAPTSAAPAGGSPTPVAFPKPEVANVILGQSAGTEFNQFPMELARQLKIYEKYGLTVKVISFNGDGAVTQALVSGQVQASALSPGQAIQSQLTDTPLIGVGCYNHTVSDDMISLASIKTPEALKGKKIGISAPGGASHASVYLALLAWKIDAKDVILQNIGGQSVRIAALLAGSIDAAPVSEENRARMTGAGLNVLIKLHDSGARLCRSALGFRKDWLAANPNTALAIAAANLEATQYPYTHLEDTVNRFAVYTQIAPADAEISVKSQLPDQVRDMRIALEDLVTPQAMVSITNPDAAKVKPETTIDQTILDKLKSMGFNAQLGLN